ncbi:hypothetical protein H6503_03190 [Candidatus Woesearchaeota archaeon]|nr:hypothetical protein [Candidatus Woesearchaeota archaeon]
MRGKKRGQISVFFILGIMLLILVVFYFISSALVSPDTASFHKKNLETRFDKESLQEFIDFCLINQTEAILFDIALNGGTLNESDLELHSKLYEGKRYRILCAYVEGSQYCVNRLLTLEDIENEIAAKVVDELDSCLDLDYFRDLGYEIFTGNKSLDIKIGFDEVNLYLDYPISMTKQGIEVSIDDHMASFVHSIGMIYYVMVDILNHETTYGTFDKDDWMRKNNMLFEIAKEKPYPYITYSISDREITKNGSPFSFRFSLQLEDKASNTGKGYVSDENYGCCYLSHSCMKSVEEITCKLKNGSYEHSNRCSCDDSIYTVDVEDFRDCGVHKHGESWCATSDGIGSRDTKFSCLDGKIIQEDCKDFHEEVCVEYSEEGMDKAICKVNRWEDCAACDSKECCENTLLRDCRWYGKTYGDDIVIEESSTLQCLPIVSPGFRFWDGAGQEICNLGTKWAKCDGWTCGNEWVQHSSTSCTELGDCGINQNYRDDVTFSGFLETDPQYKPYIAFLDRGYITINSKQEDLLFTEFVSTIDLIPAMISAMLNYFDDVLSRKSEILDYSFCGLYEAPLGGQCSKCGDDCTEYRCHSIGQNCLYDEEDGFPRCISKTANSGDIIINVPSDDYEVKTMIINGNTLRGYEHRDDVLPFELIEFNISTNVPTKCKITYYPEMEFSTSPAIWLGNPSYSTSHNISFRLPSSVDVPKQIYDSLNVSSLNELYGLFIELNDTLRDYFDDKFVKMLDKANDYLNDKDYMRELLNITISGIDKNEYYTFFRCSDESGNYNIDPIYLKYKIDDITPDLRSPQIVYSIPSNGSYLAGLPYSLTIFLDEPSECKYSDVDEGYGVMPYEFECETSEMRPSLYGGGSYSCTTNTSLTEVYIKCMDKPVQISKHEFSVAIGMQEDYNYTESEIDDAVIMIGQNSVEDVNFLMDYHDSCRIGFNGYDYGLMTDLSCIPDSFGLKMNCTHDFAGNNYDVYLMCVDGIYQERNINQESHKLTFFEDDELSIISYFPDYDAVIGDSVSIGLVVNKNIEQYGVSCGYGFHNGEFYQLYPVGYYQFRRNIHDIDAGDYDIEFKCTDISGNIAYGNTRFIAS